MNINELATTIFNDTTVLPDEYITVDSDEGVLYSIQPEGLNIIHSFDPEKVDNIILDLKNKYPDRGFRWLIPPTFPVVGIELIFSKYGFKYVCEAHNYGKDTDKLNSECNLTDDYEMVRVKTFDDMRNYVEVASSMTKTNKQYTDGQIKMKLKKLSDKDIMYNILHRPTVSIVSTCAGRIYSKYNLLYLCGAYTLPEFQRKGLYKESISARVRFAMDNNLSKILSIAREDTSGPILNSVGFTKHGASKFWTGPHS